MHPTQTSQYSYNETRSELPSTLLASPDSVINSLVTLSSDLRLEVDVNELYYISLMPKSPFVATHLALLRSPFAIGIPVVDNLVASSIPDLGSSVREDTVGGPLKLVAG
jgi:hypothetical protein